MDPRDHLAAAVDDHGVGRPVEAEAVRDREPRVEGHGIGDVLFADEALRVDGGVLDVKCQDLDAALAVALPTRASAADSVTHGLHHDAWKRRTRTFLPIRSRESNARLLPRMRTLKPGAAGAAASDETKHSRSRRAQRGRATTKAIITHAIDRGSGPVSPSRARPTTAESAPHRCPGGSRAESCRHGCGERTRCARPKRNGRGVGSITPIPRWWRRPHSRARRRRPTPDGSRGFAWAISSFRSTHYQGQMKP